MIGPYPSWWLFNGLLLVLQVLHIVWSYLIARIAFKAFIRGKVRRQDGFFGLCGEMCVSQQAVLLSGLVIPTWTGKPSIKPRAPECLPWNVCECCKRKDPSSSCPLRLTAGEEQVGFGVERRLPPFPAPQLPSSKDFTFFLSPRGLFQRRSQAEHQDINIRLLECLGGGAGKAVSCVPASPPLLYEAGVLRV